MKVLAISDKIVDFIYSSAVRERFADVDLVLSCGDLPYYYLEFIVSMLDKPLFFVRGNHANLVEHGPDGPRTRPWGAVDLDRQVINFEGLLMAGFEGSLRYNRGPFQYTDQQMYWHVMQIIPRLFLNRAIHGRFLDVLVTHAPPLGVGDDSDRCHTGFSAFRRFLEWFKPRWMLHGHIHIYQPNAVTRLQFHQTEVINCYGYRELELVPGAVELGAVEAEKITNDDRTTDTKRLRPSDTKGVLESD
ncbi:MAG: metallophosphoesterase [Chloroflexota bacterium]|nr:metallophosphoesterase [Chloroflexota bacterium]